MFRAINKRYHFTPLKGIKKVSKRYHGQARNDTPVICLYHYMLPKRYHFTHQKQIGNPPTPLIKGGKGKTPFMGKENQVGTPPNPPTGGLNPLLWDKRDKVK